MRIRTLVLTTLLLAACRDYRQLTRQLPTFANMKSVAREIQRIRERDGSISDEAALAVVRRINDGRDEWGHRLVYASKAEPVFSFVLISPGEDGVFERDAPELYFDAPREDIIGRLERDIVFRDGVPVTIASAK
jgi:hypothetical protein